MKDRSTCVVDGHNCSSEYEDDLMECGDFLDLVGLTKEMESGEVDIYMMAERIANMLGQGETSDDDDDDDDVKTSRRVEWNDDADVAAHEHNLLLAGYTSCMDEAIRYLVEEEQYSLEHPIVQGLKHHLASQQERVLVEAARVHVTADANDNSANAMRVERPPSI